MTSDHDLLIEIKTTLHLLIKQLDEHKISMNAMTGRFEERFDQIEKNKLSKADAIETIKNEEKKHTDYERRLRRLEWSAAIATGAILFIKLIQSIK